MTIKQGWTGRVFEDFEVLEPQGGEIFALAIDNGHTKCGQIDPGAKSRRLRVEARHRDCDGGHDDEA